MTLATVAKVAATVLTNDKLRKTVGWIIAILSPLILLLVVVCSFMSGGADHNATALDLCYYGSMIAGSVPEAYRQHITDMQNSLTIVDSNVASVNAMAENGSGLDSNRVKAVFYSLYFGEENPSAVGVGQFVDCFVQYEERTDTWTDDDGSEHIDTYTVAIPVSLETAYKRIFVTHRCLFVALYEQFTNLTLFPSKSKRAKVSLDSLRIILQMGIILAYQCHSHH